MSTVKKPWKQQLEKINILCQKWQEQSDLLLKAISNQWLPLKTKHKKKQ